MAAAPPIRTPDQRLRVFISSTLVELADERVAARAAVEKIHLTPVMFEAGARAHPPRELYRAYLAQSDVFVGIYWNRYGWVAPGETLSGLEDEYVLSDGMPRLIYIKRSDAREPRLNEMLERVKGRDDLSFRPFTDAEELRTLIADDLAHMLTERFAASQHTRTPSAPGAPSAPSEPARLLLAPDRLSAPPDEGPPLVGRDALLDDVANTLADGDARIVTLTGAGGTGKTVLAVQLAHRLAARFPDGVFYVPLAGVRDPSAVIQTIVTTLEIPTPPGGGDAAKLLESFLRGRRALLVLDNFEQVLDAATDVAAALAICRSLRLLVTSRTPLHVRGEREVAVPPLSAAPEEGGLAPAVALFEARARAVVPSFRVDASNQPAVVEICRRLDGLPLAVELAAARVRVLTPQAMLARLDKSLALLVGGARDAPARQRTLRGTFEWSYELLAPPERLIFTRLGAFTGGFSLDAAEAACGDVTELDALTGLESLVDKNLVVRGEALGEPRFRLLETAREFALEKLQAAGDEQATRARIGAWAERVASELWEGALQGGSSHWRDRFAVEEPHLRAVLAWCCVPGGDLQLGWRCFAKIGGAYLGQARMREVGEWERRLLAAGPCTDDDVRLDVDVVLGAVAAATNDIPRALALLRGTPERLRAAGRRALAAWAALMLSQPMFASGDPAALPLLLSARDDARHGGTTMLAGLHVNLAMVFLGSGDIASARSEAKACLDVCMEHGNNEMLPIALGIVGRVAFIDGDLETARTQLSSAVAISRATNHPWGGSMSLFVLASMALAKGDARETTACLEQALAWMRAAGPGSGVELAAGGLAALALREGDRARAIDLFRIVPAGWEAAKDNPDIDMLDMTRAIRAAITEARTTLGDDARAAADIHAVFDDVLDRALGKGRPPTPGT